MYKKILKNPLIFRLSVVQFIAYFGSWFSNVAIYTMILNFGVDPLINALVVSMYALPALLAPFYGALVDKYLSKKLMIYFLIVELLMTLSYLFITDITQIWLLLILIYIRTSASFLFFNAEMSLLPQLLKDEELKKANELHSIIWSVTFALGMAVGGVVVDKFGIYNTIVIDSLLFVVAIFVFLGIKFDLAKKLDQSMRVLIKEGFAYLLRDKKLRILILVHSSVALTTFDTLINLLTDLNYKYIVAIPLAIGWLNATRAVGLMVGPFVIGDKVSEKTLHIFFYLQGIFIIIWAIVEHDFYLSLFMMFWIGFFTTTLWSYTYTLIQNQIDDRYLGRVLAYNEMIFMGMAIVVTMFTGIAYKAGISLFMITLFIGISFLLSGFFYKRWYDRV
jgi:MFS family permease